MPASTTSDTSRPKTNLFSWREILKTLRLPNDEQSRRKVRRAHVHFGGPIRMPSKGGQPFVCAEDLVNWWNDLAADHREREQRHADEQATVQDHYQHG